MHGLRPHPPRRVAFTLAEVLITLVSGKEVLDKVGWAFSPTLKYCWGRNPNLQKAISSASLKATRHVRGDLVPAFTLAEVFSPYYLSPSRIAFTLAEVFLPSYHSPRKVAFTLAEVLITLGIIGVIAAMTLPTLMANYQKKVSATRAKQTYSIIAQAIKLSEAQNGEAKYWDTALSTDKGIANTELFLQKYILPYLKEPKFCGEGNSDDVIAKCGVTVSEVGQTYSLPNGVYVSFLSAGSRTMGDKPEGAILYVSFDINGPVAPNMLGDDRFYFWLTEKGLAPFAAYNNLTREEILQGKSIVIEGVSRMVACKKIKSESDDDYYRHGCTLLLMMDGWEFKDDYPW